MTSVVIATTRVVGFHCWPEAPEQVAYLRAIHRHEFHIRVEVVTTVDRQVEFQLLRQVVEWEVEARWPHGATGVYFGTLSCEGIARMLLLGMAAAHPIRAVEVWEDGENGARVEA